MDRRLIQSVAGSGKTSYLIDRLDRERRFLLVTYTINNTEHLKNCIIRKFGYLPNNITVYTYFEFLLAVCYRPFLADTIGAKGIDWKMPDPATLRFKRSNRAFYINPKGCLYHNRIALLCEPNAEKIARRIEKYYDCLYYDEAQDLGGHDFNLFLRIIQCNIEVLVVGDFFQHTFFTSQDGNTNSGLYDNLEKYLHLWNKARMQIDTDSLKKSHRCSPSITEFVRNNIGVNIFSHESKGGQVSFITEQNDVDAIVTDGSTPKLFLSDAKKYRCNSINWGDSKGLDDFVDVCIVLNQRTLQLYNKGRLNELAPLTKNKFYVACTRARRNIYFVPYTSLEKYKILDI